ncbi:MAG: ATP-binding protein [Bacteroidetes bacterium]|nr:ATP-binding protein [Bacteroidota bacterium]MCB0846328.1 ATP-binding protein [Bacteroidota bacterium]
MNFIGREREIRKLERVKNSNRSEFVAIYGRRRVGKTLLVRTVFENTFTFQLTAIANISRSQQLLNFSTHLQKYRKETPVYEIPPNWFWAFQQLIDYLEKCSDKKKVIFLDELPWFDNQKSDFIPALEHFWNSWAATRDDILLVVCGSAASWIINKLINHKGGLHNRVTERIKLEPFSLKEAEELLKQKNAAITRYQILQLYMVMGGIPFYLDQVEPTRSAMQNIEEICFAADGLLRLEFDNLFKALFSKAERHISVVRAIAKKSKGLTRQEIIDVTQLSNSGTLTRVLDELEKSGFIRRYNPFQKKKKNSLYQLVDFYTLFYLRFIENSDPLDRDNWQNAIDTPGYRTWSGYAFEQICLYHIHQIKLALGISGVISHTFSWKSQDKEQGAQIDLIIDRRDQVINLCEMKFSVSPFVITKSYANQLRNKIAVFREETGTKKALYLTMVTTYGVNKNTHSVDLVQNDLEMEVLFT